jgi:hypothetical protein
VVDEEDASAAWRVAGDEAMPHQAPCWGSKNKPSRRLASGIFDRFLVFGAAALAALSWLAGAPRFPVDALLRVAPSPASEVVLPPASWPVAEDVLSDLWPNMSWRSISGLDLEGGGSSSTSSPPSISGSGTCGSAASTINGSEGLAMSELERAPEPKLEPPSAEEMAEPAGVVFVRADLG